MNLSSRNKIGKLDEIILIIKSLVFKEYSKKYS